MVFPIKYLIKLASLFYWFGFGLITLWIWIYAFISGGNIIVSISDLGEMYPELIILGITVPLMFYGMLINIKEMIKQ